MLTKKQVQQAIELLKRKRQAYTDRPVVGVREYSVPEGETRLMLLTTDYADWKPIFDAHPELRDALTLVVMASFPTETRVMAIAPLIQRSISEWVDFYEGLPPDVLDTDPPLGRHTLIRNLADKVFFAMSVDDDTVIDADDRKRLLSLAVSRPPVVQAGGLKAQLLHDMLFKALVYPLLPESERRTMLEQVADAVEQFIDAYGTGAFPEINGEVFTRIAYPIEFLPITHVFSSALVDPEASGVGMRYFTAVLGSYRYRLVAFEQGWVYENFGPLFDEGLRDLFARRDFSHDSLRAVLRKGFAKITKPSALKQILKEIWKRGFSATFYGLMAVFSREFPEQAARIARLVARAVPNDYAATMYRHLAQGSSGDENSELVGLVSQPMRDAAKAALPIVYQRVFHGKRYRSHQFHERRGEFARVTASAVLGIETDDMKHYYLPDVWIDLWEGFHTMLTNPSELLKDPQKLAAYRKARERVFEDRLGDDFCEEGADDE